MVVVDKGTPLLFFLLIVFLSLNAQSEFINTVYTAVLSTDTVVPVKSDAGGEGVAICILHRNDFPYSLDCEVQFHVNPVFGPFYAGIYRGSETENGELLYEFTVEIDSNFRQEFTLDSVLFTQNSVNETYTTEQQEYDFLNGRWYIIISSPDYPLGAIRGSLLHQHFIYARMDNGNVVPRINEERETNAHGLAVASFSNFDPRKTASFLIVHDVDETSRIKINGGDAGEIGAADYVFAQAASPVREDVLYTSITEDKLLDDGQYLEVYSLSYPNGEIRGQLDTIDQLPSAAFTSRLDGLSMLPNHVSTIARGCGLFSLDCKSLRLEYLLYHTVSAPTGVWMNLGNDRYTDGIKIWPLARVKGPIYGSRLLTADEVIAFYQQRLYVTVESLAYPEGEIRGQISDTYNYYAYLTGTQLLPPRTTSAVGCATLRMDEVTNKGRKLNYDIHFQLAEAKEVVVDLVHGDVGLEGETMYTLGSTYSSLSGSNVFLSNSEVNYVGTEKTYLQVGDPAIAGGTGKLRGQIYHVINPCPFITSRPDNQPKTPTSSWDRYEVPTYIEWNNMAPSLSPFKLFFYVPFFLVCCNFLIS